MSNPPKLRRPLLHVAIVTVLLTFFAVPISLLLYGGLAAAVTGLAIITIVAVIQLSIYWFLNRFKLLPTSDEVGDDDLPSGHNRRCP